MQRELSQEEIDAMVRAARGQKPEGIVASAVAPQPCDFRQAGQLSRELVQSISGIYEVFARSLSQALSICFSLPVEVLLVSVEQLTYNDFLTRTPEITYIVSVRMRQLYSLAALQIDHSFVFPAIDILLGGDGKCPVLTREVTQIEESLMEEVAKIISQKLESSWQMLRTDIALEARLQPAQMQRLMHAMEKVLALSFEIRMNEAHGMLNVIFPASASSALFRKLSKDLACSEKREPALTAERLRKKIADCEYRVELGITHARVPATELINLQPGQVLNLRVPVRNPASVIIAEREVFQAYPVRCDDFRAARISAVLTGQEEGD